VRGRFTSAHFFVAVSLCKSRDLHIIYGATSLTQTSIFEESRAERGFPQKYISRPTCVLP